MDLSWTTFAGIALGIGLAAATGFRAPSISQISDSFSLSFHSFGERRIIDSLRCNDNNSNNAATPPATFNSPAINVNVSRDCNVLGYTPVPAGTVNPGNIPTVVGGNPARFICTTAAMVERMETRSNGYPWIGMIQSREGAFDARMEPELVRMRQDTFYGELH